MSRRKLFRIKYLTPQKINFCTTDIQNKAGKITVFLYRFLRGDGKAVTLK